MRLFGRLATSIAICLVAFVVGPSSANAVADSCAIITATRDGFVSLREGPGTHYREITRLPGGQFIGIDDLQGDPKREWIHVNGLMDRTSTGDLTTVRIVEGWAFARYLHPIDCMVERPPPVKQAQPQPEPPTYRPPPQHDRQPTPLALPPAASSPAPRASALEHGVVRRRAGPAIAPFRITTSDGANYFFKLVRRYTNEEEMVGFIVGGRPLETKVPSGSYELRYAAGDTWISEEEFFGPNTAFAKAESPLTFSIDGDRARGVEVQLILQRGGNLRTSPIKRSEF